MSAYPHFAVFRRCFCRVYFVVLRSCCVFTRRALCALCSVGSAGSLAVFFLCIFSFSSSVLLRSLEAEGQSVDSRFTCEGSFMSPRSTLNVTASGLSFNSCKELSSTFHSRNNVKACNVKDIVLRLHFRCIPLVTTALVPAFPKNYCSKDQ